VPLLLQVMFYGAGQLAGGGGAGDSPRQQLSRGCVEPSNATTDRFYACASAFNQPIPAGTPSRPNDASLIRQLVVNGPLGPQLGGTPAVYFGDNATSLVTVYHNYPTCHFQTFQIPIPVGARSPWGLDQHNVESTMAVMQTDTGVEWDLYHVSAPGEPRIPSGGGVSGDCGTPNDWSAEVVTKFDPGWTGLGNEACCSGRASHTYQGTGNIRPRDTRLPVGATWDHALGFSYAGELNETVYPAKHNDGVCIDRGKCVPAGARFQLDRGYPCATTAALSLEWQRQMCRTLQVYGLIVIDKPCDWPCVGGGVHSENPESVRLPIGASVDGGGGYRFPYDSVAGDKHLPTSLLAHMHVLDWAVWTGEPHESSPRQGSRMKNDDHPRFPVVPCYDPVDATDCLQAALDSGGGRATTVHVPNTGPWLISKKGLWVTTDNLVVTLAPGVVIEAAEGAFHDLVASLFAVAGADNFTLRGLAPLMNPLDPASSSSLPTLRMRKADYMNASKYTHSEWRHALWIGRRKGSGCPWAATNLSRCGRQRPTSNVWLSGIRVESSGGDGIMVDNATDITIAGVDSNDNNRQGMSIINVDGLTVSDSSFRNTFGAPPQAGIDIEPDKKTQHLKKIELRNVHCSNNSGSGLEIEFGSYIKSKEPVSINVTEITLRNNTLNGLAVISSVSLLGAVTVSNLTVHGTQKGAGILLLDHSTTGASLTINNSTIVGVSASSSPVMMARHGPPKKSTIGVSQDFGGVAMHAISIVDGALCRPFLVANMSSGTRVLLETAKISFTGTVANGCSGGECVYINDSRRHGPRSISDSNFDISTNCSAGDEWRISRGNHSLEGDEVSRKTDDGSSAVSFQPPVLVARSIPCGTDSSCDDGTTWTTPAPDLFVSLGSGIIVSPWRNGRRPNDGMSFIVSRDGGELWSNITHLDPEVGTVSSAGIGAPWYPAVPTATSGATTNLGLLPFGCNATGKGKVLAAQCSAFKCSATASPSYATLTVDASAPAGVSANNSCGQVEFRGYPHPLLPQLGMTDSFTWPSNAVRLADGSLVMSFALKTADETKHPPKYGRGAVSPMNLVVFRSTDGLVWDYLSTAVNHTQLAWSFFGPNEHDISLLSDNRTLVMVMRTDADGACPGRPHYTFYYQTYSRDNARTWSEPRPIPNVGSVRPKLLLLESGALLLSGGRLCKDDLDPAQSCIPTTNHGRDGEGGVLLWVNSDGMADVDGKRNGTEWKPHCVTAAHNTGWSGDPALLFNDTSDVQAYTSLVAHGPRSARIFYEHGWGDQPHRVGFTMRVDVTTDDAFGAPKLHYTAGSDAAAFSECGFTLADVNPDRSALDSLPAGVQGLVWVGDSPEDGASAAWKAEVKAVCGHPKTWGYYIADEPLPSVPVAALRARAEHVHTTCPGAETFIVLDNDGTDAHPEFRFTPANTNISLFGIDPYPFKANLVNLSIIGSSVDAAIRAGIAKDKLVPVFQAFGAGNQPDCPTDGCWKMPDVRQTEAMLQVWDALLPEPVFDMVYAWGVQLNDTALKVGAPALRSLYAQRNRARPRKLDWTSRRFDFDNDDEATPFKHPGVML
jgi:hypothetical protein